MQSSLDQYICRTLPCQSYEKICKKRVQINWGEKKSKLRSLPFKMHLSKICITFNLELQERWNLSSKCAEKLYVCVRSADLSKNPPHGAAHPAVLTWSVPLVGFVLKPRAWYGDLPVVSTSFVCISQQHTFLFSHTYNMKIEMKSQNLFW